MSEYSRDDLLWAGGLFVGEGYVALRHLPGLRAPRPSVAIKMLDRAALTRFAAIFGLHVYAGAAPYDDSKTVFRASVFGSGAIRMLQALAPVTAGTSKGDRIRSILGELTIDRELPQDWIAAGKPVQDGAPRPRRTTKELLDTAGLSRDCLVWASGLFAAEGYAGAVPRGRAGGKRHLYPVLSLSMLDAGAVSIFASTFDVRMYSFPHYPDPTKTCYRAQIYGRGAEGALRALYPYLLGTEKGEQVRAVFDAVGMSLGDDGSGMTFRRGNGRMGVPLTRAHKEAIAAGQRRRWARSRA